MTPVLVTLTDTSEILIHIDDVEGFLAEIDDIKLGLVDSVEPIDGGPTTRMEDTELVEVDLMFIDGCSMRCFIPAAYKDDLEAHTLIRSCEGVAVMDKLRGMAAVEKSLDARMRATYAVINNIPTLSRRAKLHEQYIQRKSAYVVSMEALIDGAFRD